MKKKTMILEGKMLRYQDLLTVKCGENNNPLVEIPPLIMNRYNPLCSDMQLLLHNKMIIRKSVSEKLIQAQKKLAEENNQFSLCITYGYRSLEVQTKRFQSVLQNTKQFFPNPYDYYEEAHRFVAVPTVAGHPTGGAIDVVLVDKKTNKTLDFGSKQYDYSSKACYVFWPKVNITAQKYRMLLRKVLLEVGFAPFDGEWWHFSYGDREWAYYYKKKQSLYSQIAFKNLGNFMI